MPLLYPGVSMHRGVRAVAPSLRLGIATCARAAGNRHNPKKVYCEAAADPTGSERARSLLVPFAEPSAGFEPRIPHVSV